MTRTLEMIHEGAIDSEFLTHMQECSDLQLANMLTKRMEAIEKATKQHYVEIGLIVDCVESRKLYSKITDSRTGKPCKSLNQWFATSAPFSRSTGYAAMNAIRQLKDIPTADLLEMPRDNINTLCYSSSGLHEKPDVIAKAKEDPEVFKTYLNDNYSQSHEVLRKTTFHLTKSATKIVEDVLAYVMKEENMTREEAAEQVFLDYANTNNLWKEME